MKRWCLVLVCVAGVLMTGGCGRQESGGTSGKRVIAVIPKGTTHSFWKSIHAGAVKASRELGVEIIWQGPHKEDDRQMQIQVVQNFISRGVDAMVLAPLDDHALVRPVESAVMRGIPVVIIDSDLQSEAHSSFVATDNFSGGELCGERLSNLLEGKGKVIMLRYAEGSASTANREQGFLGWIADNAPGIEVLSSSQYAGATMEKAFQAAQNLLNRFPDVDGIFCPNESSTQGMLRALQTAGRAGTAKFVGFDSNEALLTALGKGELHGLALQSPFKMGYLGVKVATDVLDGRAVEARVDTGIVMLTPENLSEPAMQELINPDLAKWLGE